MITTYSFAPTKGQTFDCCCRGNCSCKNHLMVTCFSSFFRKKHNTEIVEEVSTIQNAVPYSYKELELATDKFSPANKIGEGGFGSVYKGILKDGTEAAVKVLSAVSRQGLREFLTEIKVIADVEHDNLVKLYGYCAEGSHRILVYGYLKNNSLAQTLLGGGQSSIQFSWSTRCKIGIGIAQGLAFLHEESQPHIIHRDIKASNILLDDNLEPKISDFGLAKLCPVNLTHVTTRVAGTAGYLAPEYAIRGQVTRKADVYSFGVLLLEIVCGRPNINRRLPLEEQYLLERVWDFYEKGELARLVDTSMNGNYNVEEACRYLKIGLLCTQGVSKLRPSMSTVVRMLTGDLGVDDDRISRPGVLSEFMVLRGGDYQKGSSGTRNFSDTAAASSDIEISSSSHATMSFTSIDDRTN